MGSYRKSVPYPNCVKIEFRAIGKVDYHELSTPLTNQHFINYGKGEIYGLDHDPERFRQKFLKPRTPKLLPCPAGYCYRRGRGGLVFGSIDGHCHDGEKCT